MRSPSPRKPEQAGLPLTDRETATLWLVADGLSNKEIAKQLHISPHTAKFHVKNAARKMGTASRTKAAVDFVLGQGAGALARIEPASPGTAFAARRAELLRQGPPVHAAEAP